MHIFKKSLYIIGIPIGSIYDFTQRAIFILKNVNIIATEDSRKSGLLLNFLNIKNKIISLNSYNELSISKKLIEAIINNSSLAFISDSGTPLINDPGFYLIKLAYKNNIKIIPVPGISAITTALSISIIKSNNFIFYGFMPKKNIQKKLKLNLIKYEIKNIIFFETSDRLINTLFNIQTSLQPNRQILILKNLTKKFEMYLTFELVLLKKIIKKINNNKKGEFVIIIDGVKKVHIEKNSININKNKNNFYTHLL
ncbi:MAG TPA: 16S rRNA (cytidine(1402)-2'-O)-methyltransferase [Candidatus Azoamicus sp.]